MKRITKEEAIELNQNFIKSKAKALDIIVEKLNNKPMQKDAISSWFSIDELKSFIKDCENSKEDVNGFRVYFGAYGKNDKTKKNLSTVFIVPTKPRIDTMQKDGAKGGEASSDITNLGGLNQGHMGDPPSEQYPQ